MHVTTLKDKIVNKCLENVKLTLTYRNIIPSVCLSHSKYVEAKTHKTMMMFYVGVKFDLLCRKSTVEAVGEKTDKGVGVTRSTR